MCGSLNEKCLRRLRYLDSSSLFGGAVWGGGVMGLSGGGVLLEDVYVSLSVFVSLCVCLPLSLSVCIPPPSLLSLFYLSAV